MKTGASTGCAGFSAQVTHVSGNAPMAIARLGQGGPSRRDRGSRERAIATARASRRRAKLLSSCSRRLLRRSPRCQSESVACVNVEGLQVLLQVTHLTRIEIGYCPVD